MVVSRNESIVIVGAGCFGISTAYHLLQRGFTDVTVLDRSERLPAPDAASTDINKSERYFVSFSLI
jgi:sarcosine oxidase/L-pipecolate oxidase